jgi:RimJ/RimL family protein N-acetyltransferase
VITPPTAITLISPFPEHYLPVAFSWIEPVLGHLADDFALRNTDALVEQARRMDALGGKTWGVLRGGRLCGWLSFEPVNEVSGVGHCFFSPHALGRKTTDAAVRLCLKEIFALGYERVSCPVLAANWRVRALLKRVGIPEEGCLKSFTKCGGRLADLVIAGITKEDFYGDHDRPGSAAGRPLEHTSGTDGHERIDHAAIAVRLDDTHVHKHAAGSAVGGGECPAERDDERHQHDADGDSGNRPDQPDVQGDRRPAATKPQRKRVRKQRSQRNSRRPD